MYVLHRFKCKSLQHSKDLQSPPATLHFAWLDTPSSHNDQCLKSKPFTTIDINRYHQISPDINGPQPPRSPFESPTRSSTRSGPPSVACVAAAVARSWGTEKAVVARSAQRDALLMWLPGKTMEKLEKNSCKLENVQQSGPW